MFEGRRFMGGRSDYAAAQKIAQSCAYFKPDDEDEWVDEVERSCYNCRFRRWTAESFDCMKKSIK